MKLFQKLSKHLNVRRIGLQSEHVTELARGGYGLLVKPSDLVEVSIVRGKEAGPIGLSLPAQRDIRIDLGDIQPIKFNVVTSLNPELFKSGFAQAATVFEPDVNMNLSIWIRTSESVDLSELDWLVKLHLID